MPGVIDFETIHVDDLPSIWSPVQRELAPDEHAKELDEQATASLLWVSPVPEQILRLVLDETAIERIFDPPDGFDSDVQGQWDTSLITFAFKRPIKLVKEERAPNKLVLEYKIQDAGYWLFEISQDAITIARI